MNRPLLNDQIMTVEGALIQAGNGHMYQQRAFFFVALQFFLAGAINISIGQLFMQTPRPGNFPCQSKSGQSQTIIQCSQEEFCKNPSYTRSDDFGPITIANDLACDNHILALILMASFHIGGSIGALYYGEQQEQRQGRFKIMIETLLLMGLSCGATIFAPSLYLLSVAFFFVNFFENGFLVSSVILIFEISSENLQKLSPPLLMVCAGVGEIIIPIFGWLPWRVTMLFLLACPLIASSIFMAFMKESPRFLVVKKQYPRAKEILNQMAQINGRVMPAEWLFEEEVKITELKTKMKLIINEEEIETAPRAYNYSVLFKYNSTRIRTICLLYLYVTFTYSQYQMADQISSISRLGSYKTIIFIGVAKTIGYLGSAYASLNNPRKETLKNVIVITAAFTVFILLWPYIFVVHKKGGIKELDHFGYSIVLMVLVISRIVISFGFSFLNVYVLEVYPTSVRHYALSFLFFSSEFAFIFYNSYQQLCYAFGINPLLGTTAALLGGLLTMQKLRETYMQPLKENLDEFQEDLLNNQVYA